MYGINFYNDSKMGVVHPLNNLKIVIVFMCIMIHQNVFNDIFKTVYIYKTKLSKGKMKEFKCNIIILKINNRN